MIERVRALKGKVIICVNVFICCSGQDGLADLDYDHVSAYNY